jgi:hypothetical protein
MVDQLEALPDGQRGMRLDRIPKKISQPECGLIKLQLARFELPSHPSQRHGTSFKQPTLLKSKMSFNTMVSASALE